MKKKLKIFIISFCAICLLGALTAVGINLYIIEYAKPYIISESEAENKNTDCVVALGAQVLPDKTPCHQLYDRVQIASGIFLKTAGEKLLLSGDSRVPEEYDEIGAMRKTAHEFSVDDKDIITDPLGLNTYTSMQNIKEQFGFNSCVIVTQEYHIYRSVYIARKMGLDAYGVASDPRSYITITMNEAREFLARIKAFYMVDIKQ